jgi:hypothetical protein
MIRSVLQPLLLVLLCSTLLSLEAQEWLEVQKVLPPNDASSPIGGQSDSLGWSVAVDGKFLVQERLKAVSMDQIQDRHSS